MAYVIISLIWIGFGVYNGCLCQKDNSKDNLPEERGLVITTVDNTDSKHSIVRHIPVFPGYEDFVDVLSPGFSYTSNGSTHVLSFDIEFRSKEFYMYDYHLSSIVVGGGYNKELDVTKLSIALLHVGVSKGTVQLALDWLSHTVYWTDSLFKWIVAVPGTTEKLDKDYYKIIIDDHLDAPDGITVDPLKGYLFWSDNGRHPKIGRSDLQGNNRHTIITKHMVYPISIEADIFDQRIYWIDSYTHSILSATYEGKDMRMVASITNSILFDLAIYKDFVYVTDIMNDNLYTFNKTSGSPANKGLSFSAETIYGIAVYSEYNQPLKDTDYCAVKNCEQLCISEENGATCICAEGYEKNETTGLCEESFANFHKAIVFANATHICMFDIRSFASPDHGVACRYTVIEPPSSTTSSTTIASTSSSTSSPTSSTPPAPTPTPTASTTEFIKMFDLDITNRIVFFVTDNNKIYKRPVDLPIENDAKELLIETFGVISGMAYDGLYTENLYWSESDTGNIWFVNVNTKSPMMIPVENSVDLVNPRDIILIPALRQLVWVAGSQGDVSIQTMTITGTGLLTVASGLPEIISPVYDNEAQVFYFISHGGLYQATLNGDVDTTILEDQSAYLLLSYKNYLAWIYTFPGYGNIWKAKDINTAATGAHATFGNTSPIVGMKVLDIKLKQPVTSPCAFFNGGCEQICIPKYTGDVMVKVCDCSLGFTLDQTDKVSCRSDVVTDNVILMTDLTNPALHQIDLRTNKINSISNKENAIYMGVYFDSNAMRVIWSEYAKSMFFSSKFDGSDEKIIGNLVGNAFPYRMDMDLTTGNLYYTTTAYYNPHIGVLTPSGDIIRLKKDVSVEILGDIVVHPGKGWMFYTVVHVISYVARANMDGTNERKIIFGDNVSFPNGLAIDFTRDHLYWSDTNNDTIQRCNLDGEECVTIVNRTGKLKPEEIRDLVTDGRFVYYSAYRNDHIKRINLMEPYNEAIVGQNPGLGKVDTMALYSSSNRNVQPVSQACQARGGLGDCSSICLPTETGRTCDCSGNVPLKPDGRTCSNIYQCSDVIRQEVQTANGNELIDIVIDSNCQRKLNEQCMYRCPHFFAPDIKANKTKTPLTCTNVGWDQQSNMLCKEIACSDSSLSNGTIVGNCSRRLGDICTYECNDGYSKTTDVILCNRNIKWSPNEPCTVIITVKEEAKGLPVTGVVVGIALLALVIFVLIGVVVYLVRRNGTSRPSMSDYVAKAEFQNRQDGGISIENPGYHANDTPTVAKRDEHPYSTVDTSQVRLGLGGHEQLPEVTQINVDRDTSTLTYTSWMKERERETRNK